MFSLSNGDEYLNFSREKEGLLTVEGKSSFLTAYAEMYVSNEVLMDFYEKLHVAYRKCSGTVAECFGYDDDFCLKLSFDNWGHVTVETKIIRWGELVNRCELRFRTDQTYVQEFLRDMKKELS